METMSKNGLFDRFYLSIFCDFVNIDRKSLRVYATRTHELASRFARGLCPSGKYNAIQDIFSPKLERNMCTLALKI